MAGLTFPLDCFNNCAIVHCYLIVYTWLKHSKTPLKTLTVDGSHTRQRRLHCKV